MKKIIISFLLYLIIFPGIVSAHLIGQPPFFKINGKYADFYTVPTSSAPNFELPQDQAPENYLLNQEINFELDKFKLPAPPEIVDKTKFTWDFGDGQKGQGLKNSHRYSKIGSFILKIDADDLSEIGPQLLESVIINILPDKNYQLPKSIIKVNGKQSKDPLTDILKFKFGNDFVFNGTGSEAKSSKIVSTFWDFGDQSSNKDIQTTHRYTSDLSQVFPVLRIVDSNGFIADSFLEIQNQNSTDQTTIGFDKNYQPVVRKKTDLFSQYKIPIFIGGILIILIGMVIWLNRKKSKKN